MFAARFMLTIVVSVVALLTSLVLDRIMAPLPALPQFFVQVPILVLLMEEFRALVLRHAGAYGLTADNVNGTFFFAAPLAAFGALSLFRDLRRIHKS
jgi:hypothetical protein